MLAVVFVTLFCFVCAACLKCFGTVVAVMVYVVLCYCGVCVFHIMGRWLLCMCLWCCVVVILLFMLFFRVLVVDLIACCVWALCW